MRGDEVPHLVERQVSSLDIPSKRIAKRIGILGGTFDPIHNGHIAVARNFIACLNLTELVLLPAGQPWQKIGVSSAQHRLAMTKIAAQALESLMDTPHQPKEHPVRVRIASDELDRPGPSYMVDTLAAWRARIGADPSLTLIIGDDQLAHLESWHAWHQLFDYAHIGVAHRAGYRGQKNECLVHPKANSENLVPTSTWDVLPKSLTAALLPRAASAGAIQTHSKGLIFWDALKMPDISSTQLRQTAANSTPSKDLKGVPRAVSKYIFEHHLYQTDPHGYSHT